MWNGLRSPAFWNLAFIAVNLRRLTQLVLAEQTCITLDADEQKLYESAFAPYGVTLRDFSTLLREGELAVTRRFLGGGRSSSKEGDPMPLLYYVVDGVVECSSTNMRVKQGLTPGQNGWLGELSSRWASRARRRNWLAGFRRRATGGGGGRARRCGGTTSGRGGGTRGADARVGAEAAADGAAAARLGPRS